MTHVIVIVTTSSSSSHHVLWSNDGCACACVPQSLIGNDNVISQWSWSAGGMGSSVDIFSAQTEG